MKSVWKILVIGSAIGLLAGCAETYEHTQVKGTVVSKEYDPAKTTYKTTKVNGVKKKKKVYEEEEYEVVVEYKNLTEEFEFEDDQVYSSVEEGDTIDVRLVTGLDKKGKVVSEKLEWVE